MKTWRIQLFGGFFLTDSHGHPVPLASTKAQAILALLVLSPSRAIDREETWANLWPHLPLAAQQANLRQAISHLRRAVGEDAIITSRTIIRLADAFQIQSELDSLEQHSQLNFEDLLADHSGLWLSETRRQLQRRLTPNKPQPVEHTPTQGFLELLRWSAENDVERAACLLRDFPEIVGGVPLAELDWIVEKLYDATPTSAPSYGWVLCWRASIAWASKDVAAGNAGLAVAESFAKEIRDDRLLAECLINHSIGLILSNDFGPVEKKLAEAHTLAIRRNRPLEVGRVKLLLGTLRMHQGAAEDAFVHMAAANTLLEPYPEDRAISQGLTALYLATSGRPAQASKAIIEPELFARKTHHARLNLIVAFTRITILLQTEDYEQALQELPAFANRAKTVGYSHFVIYAREAEALALWRLREKSDAMGQLQSSHRTRRSMNMNYTQWDKSRLGDLPVRIR